MKGCRSLALLAAVVSCAGALAESPSVSWKAERKKVVSFGWEWAPLTAADYVRYADRIDRTGLDGVGVHVMATTPDGQRFNSAYVGRGTSVWTKDIVRGQVEDFRTANAHPGLRESFIRTMGAPHERLDWANDEVWRRIAKNMGVLAWLAKEGGFRGLVIDPEDYHKARQFERRPGDAPWSVLAPLARRRGREIFTEVFREFPDAVVFAYWLFSWNIYHAYASEPIASARCGGDLWSSFANGILDAMPPTARIVDGNEWAYEIEAKSGEFEVSSIAQRNCEMGLVAPENRRKYRAQVLPGFGLYLDSYTNPKTNANGKANHYYYGPDESGTRLGHLERNLSAALRASGGYVWLWGESFSWITYDPEQKMGWKVSRERWADRLPGLYSAIRACANPEAFLVRDFPILRKAGRVADLAAGQDVVAMSEKALGKDHDPKDETQRGKGYFHIGDEKAVPGSHYVIVIDGHGEGLEAVAYWLNRKNGGYWRWRIPGQGIVLRDLPDGKRHGEAVIYVPEGVDGMKVQFRLNPEPGKTCGFDKVFLGKVVWEK